MLTAGPDVSPEEAGTAQTGRAHTSVPLTWAACTHMLPSVRAEVRDVGDYVSKRLYARARLLHVLLSF